MRFLTFSIPTKEGTEFGFYKSMVSQIQFSPSSGLQKPNFIKMNTLKMDVFTLRV